MGRLACLSLPALPLQLLLRQHPEWKGHPAAVVAEDKPQGLILYVNRAAARAGVRPGWRYGAALSLVRGLRAGAVAPETVAAEMAQLTGRLQRLTPQVEPAAFAAPRGERSAAELSAPRDKRSVLSAPRGQRSVLSAPRGEGSAGLSAPRGQRSAAGEPGVFWLGVEGLRPVFPDLDAWGEAVLRSMREAGFTGAVAVGFTHFGTYAAVREGLRYAASARERDLRAATGAPRGRPGVTVFADPQAERDAARQVPLARLGLHPEARERLEQLGIRTAGEFAALPDAGILERFGPEVHGLHRLARGIQDEAAPGGGFEPALTPQPLREPAVQTVLLEYPEANLETLLFLVKSRLHPLLSLLAARRQGLAALEVRLQLEGEARPAERLPRGADDTAEPLPRGADNTERLPRGADNTERLPRGADGTAKPLPRGADGSGANPRPVSVRPAAPTLDAVLILDLLRLRLEGVTLEQGVVALVLVAHGGPAPLEQLRLFAEHPRRDLRAGEQALARLRAEFGEEAVARAVLKPGHLPEAQFAWAPVERLAFPALTPGPSPASGRGETTGPELSAPRDERSAARALVRRLYPQATALPSPERNPRDGTFVTGQVRGTVVRRLGPYPVSGAWWAREVRRDYYYAETAQGELLWLYYDRRRRQWFLQGRVE